MLRYLVLLWFIEPIATTGKRGIPEHNSYAIKGSETQTEQEKRMWWTFVQYALISLLNVVQICKGINGNDALFGEGVCQAWVQQMCVELTKQTYETLTEDDSPYMVVSTL